MDELQKLVDRLRFEWETNEEYVTRFSRQEQTLILTALDAVNDSKLPTYEDVRGILSATPL